ncbi:MAG: hypothetical protein ATN34_01120, partial [Epulopiscium sp. Nele67-Bin002]
MTSEILRYMQMPYHEASDEFKEQVASVYKEIEDICKPKVICEKYVISLTDNGVYLTDMDFEVTGNDLRKIMASCKSMYILMATLGTQADTFIRRSQTMAISDGLIANACANVLIESVCDMAEEGIDEEYLTMRYSPGYGDVSLDVQEPLIRMLSATKRIGLSTSRSGMLIPTKSVTAFIGVSN